MLTGRMLMRIKIWTSVDRPLEGTELYTVSCIYHVTGNIFLEIYAIQ